MIGLAFVLLMGIAIYVLTPRSYGETSQEGYRFAVALFSACNQKDLERVKKVEMLVSEYAEKKEIKANEKRWLADIIKLAHEGKWEKAQQNARKLLDAQVEPSKKAVKPVHEHSADE